MIEAVLIGGVSLLLGGVCAAVGLRYVAAGVGYLRRAVGLRRGDPTPVDSVDRSARRVDTVGRARGETVTAPFSGVDVLACEYAVVETDKGFIAAEGTVGGSFALTGDRGQVRVDPAAFPVVAPEQTVFRTAGGENSLPEGVSRRLDAVGEGSSPAFDPANSTGNRRYVERRIEPGDRVRVVGRLDGAGRVTHDTEGLDQLVRGGEPRTELRETVGFTLVALVFFVGIGLVFVLVGLSTLGSAVLR